MIKYLPELLKENVISQEIADNITDYYLKQKKKDSNKLFVIFGVLGALLIGLGIILIIAHDWDTMQRNIKVILSLSPLIAAQVVGGFVLLKKNTSIVWKESTATFLFFSIGACISLISQIYHISGDLSMFLLVWMSLSLPVIYLMNSSFTSLLYIVGITYYSCEAGYWSSPHSEPYQYWLLLFLAIPHYLTIVKSNVQSNFVKFHTIFISLSIIISLGTMGRGDLMYISYFSLFAILLMIDTIPFFQKYILRDKTFDILGFAGTMVLLFILSFNGVWDHMAKEHNNTYDLQMSKEIAPLIITTLIALMLFYKKYTLVSLNRMRPIEFNFLLFIVIYIFFSSFPALAITLINAIILTIGIFTIINGLKSSHLGILNLGLLVIAVLVICRFFDSHLSFLTRGLLFVSVGVSFFLTNYQMLKNRRKNEN